MLSTRKTQRAAEICEEDRPHGDRYGYRYHSSNMDTPCDGANRRSTTAVLRRVVFCNYGNRELKGACLGAVKMSCPTDMESMLITTNKRVYFGESNVIQVTT